MVHITLSIPDGVYREMKKHPEIKWSEIARQSIIQKTTLLKNRMHSHDLFNLLSPETKKGIGTVSEKEAIEFYKKMERKAWKRKKYLTRA